MSHITDVSKSMSARQKLEAQVTENNIVKEVRNNNTQVFSPGNSKKWSFVSHVVSVCNYALLSCVVL